MLSKDFISTAIALAIGWLLSETSSYLRSRNKDKSAIASALFACQEFRLRVSAFKASIDQVSKHFEMTPQDRLKYRTVLENYTFGSVADAMGRLDNVLATIVTYDPDLAVRVSMVKGCQGLTQYYRDLADVEPDSSWAIEVFEQILTDQFIDDIDDLILLLARKHSWRTWYQFRSRLRIIKNNNSQDPAFDELMTGFKKILEERAQRH